LPSEILFRPLQMPVQPRLHPVFLSADRPVPEARSYPRLRSWLPEASRQKPLLPDPSHLPPHLWPAYSSGFPPHCGAPCFHSEDAGSSLPVCPDSSSEASKPSGAFLPVLYNKQKVLSPSGPLFSGLLLPHQSQKGS